MTASLVLAALAIAFLPTPTYRALRLVLALPGRLHGHRHPRPPSAGPRASPGWHAAGIGCRAGGSGLGRPVLILVDARRRKGVDQ